MGKSAPVGPLEELVSINVLGSSRHYYIIRSVVKSLSSKFSNTEWPKKMYTLFTDQYLWNKFK